MKPLFLLRHHLTAIFRFITKCSAKKINKPNTSDHGLNSDSDVAIAYRTQ